MRLPPPWVRWRFDTWPPALCWLSTPALYLHSNGVTDPCGGSLLRIEHQVRIPCSGINLAVIQKLADHRQALAQRQGATSVRMTQIVQADVIKPRKRFDYVPRSLQRH